MHRRFTLHAEGFKQLDIAEFALGAGEVRDLGRLTLVAGGVTETVNVTAETVMVQSQSAERSYVVETAQIENLPITRGNFINVVAFTPGVNGTTRLGGVGQNNPARYVRRCCRARTW